MALQLRCHCRKTLQNPYICRFFSSSNGGEDDKTSPSPSSSSTDLSGIKSSLRQSSPPHRTFQNPNSRPSYPPPQPSRPASLQEIGKNLSEFRRRSAAPSSPDGRDAPSAPSIAFEDVYNRNVTGQGKMSFDSIREKLKRLRDSSPAAGLDQRKAPGDNRPNPLSLLALRDTLKHKPPEDSPSSPDSLRISLFGRETAEVKTEADSQAATRKVVKTYKYDDLGKKLKQLRPPEAASKKDWFSIGELNERLTKLREIDEEEEEPSNKGFSAKFLKDCLVGLKNSNDARTKKQSSRFSL